MFAVTVTAIYVVTLVVLMGELERLLISLVMYPALYNTGIILALASVILLTILWGDVIT